MKPIILLNVCGIFNIILVIFHLFFWKIFRWKLTLAKGTRTNKAIIQIFNIQLLVLFTIMAFIYLKYPLDLLKTPLGNAVLIGFAIFWTIRFFQQFIFLKQKGTMVFVLNILFFIGAIIHTLPLLF